MILNFFFLTKIFYAKFFSLIYSQSYRLVDRLIKYIPYKYVDIPTRLIANSLDGFNFWLYSIDFISTTPYQCLIHLFRVFLHLVHLVWQKKRQIKQILFPFSKLSTSKFRFIRWNDISWQELKKYANEWCAKQTKRQVMWNKFYERYIHILTKRTCLLVWYWYIHTHTTANIFPVRRLQYTCDVQ